MDNERDEWRKGCDHDVDAAKGWISGRISAGWEDGCFPVATVLMDNSGL